MSILFTPQKIGKMMLKNMEGKFDLEEGYNLEAAKRIKPVMQGGK